MATSGASAFFGRHYPNLTTIRVRTVMSAVALDLRSVPLRAAGSPDSASSRLARGLLLSHGAARDRISGTMFRGRPNGRSVHVTDA